ncbi:MAG: inositol monophosphatase family protein, partial [Myxococcota bacterium]
RGRGCFCNDAPMKLRPSTSAIADATLSVGDMRPLFGAPWGPSVLALIEEAENARCYGDLVGVTLVLKGIADVWLEAGVKPWDVAPMPVLVEEAGGVFTDFRGTQDLDHGSAIVAGPELHPEILRRFQD